MKSGGQCGRRSRRNNIHPEVELYLVPAPSKPGLVGFVRHKWAKRAKEVPGIIRSSQNRKEKRNITFRNRRAYLGSDAAAQNMGGSLTDVPQSLFARDETPEHPVLTPLDTSHASIPAHNESPFSTSNATTSRGRDRSTAKHGQSVLEGLERTGSGSGNRSNPGVGERVSRRSSGDASGRGSGELGTLAQEAAPSTLKAPRTPGSRGENAVQPSPNLAQNRDLPPGFGISSKRTNPSTSADTPQKGGRSSKATGKVGSVVHPHNDVTTANGGVETAGNGEFAGIVNGTSGSHATFLDCQPPLPSRPPLPNSSPTPSIIPREPLRFPQSVSDLHFSLIGYENDDVDLLIEQLTSQGATFVQDPHPQLVNLISLSKDRFDQKGIEGYLPTRDYVDYEIVFIFGLEDLWSLARSSLVPGSPFLIREESMCYRAGVLIVADSLSLRTCSLEEMEGIISALQEGYRKIPRYLWKLKVSEASWADLKGEAVDPLMKSKLGLLWSERQDPMDPFQVGEEKVFEFMQNNDQSSSKSAEPPQVVRDAVKMAWRNRGSCRHVFLLVAEGDRDERRASAARRVKESAENQTTIQVMTVSAVLEKVRWIVREKPGF